MATLSDIHRWFEEEAIDKNDASDYFKEDKDDSYNNVSAKLDNTNSTFTPDNQPSINIQDADSYIDMDVTTE